nr:FGGY family carbohydrate kinase [Brevundimonas aurantiaca]
MSLILAIDQGTTSTRAVAFEVRDKDLRPVAVSQIELAQHFPYSGWVEHDAAEIWSATLQTCREVVRQAGGVDRFAAVGLTNQRETSVMWDAATGEPLHRAIVWQDRRTADVTARLTAEGHEPAVQAATGLILDPYFSATKFAWLLDAVPGSRERAARGEVKLGTIDAWLIWKLTGGRVHATDAANASRTALMDLKTVEWRDDLCVLFDVPRQALAAIVPCAGRIGETDPALFGRPCPSPDRRAISRPPSSATALSRRATPRSPTAPAPFWWPMSAPSRWLRPAVSWARSATRPRAAPPMRWRGRSSRPARRSSG